MTSSALGLDARTKPFALALLIFFIAWSILPPLTSPNPPLDSVEHFAWGANFEFGYYKHPPLVAWLYGVCRHLGTGSQTFMWLSPACVALAAIFTWRAVRHVVDETTALWGAALGQAIWLHNYFIPEFNENIAEMPVFAAAGFFAIRSYKFGKLTDWLGLGAVIGIGMWAKYLVAISPAVIALYFLADPAARKKLLTPGPYIAAATAALIFAPHIVWMAQNHVSTVQYALSRGGSAPSALGHLVNTIECAGETILVLLMPTLFIWLGRDKTKTAGADWPVTNDAGLRRLVLALAFGPIALSALMALVAGVRVKSAWIAPFWEFAPLALLMLGKIEVSQPRWRRTAIATTIFAILGLIIYCGANVLGPSVNKKPMRVHFPGAQLASRVDEIWAVNAPGKPFKIIIGDVFEAGSAAYFSQSRPLVRIDDDPGKSPWAPDALKRQAGAIIVWNVAKEGAAIPARYLAQNPTAHTAEIVSLPYQTRGYVAPARIGIAYLPPTP